MFGLGVAGAAAGWLGAWGGAGVGVVVDAGAHAHAHVFVVFAVAGFTVSLIIMRFLFCYWVVVPQQPFEG